MNQDAQPGYYKARDLVPAETALPVYLREALPAPRQTRILDIGCGFGALLRALQHEGYTDVHGLDSSQEAVDYCRSRGLGVHLGDAERFAEDPPGRFDAVILSHVLEHLPKDHIVTFLKNVRERVLAPGGALFVMVPNAQSNTAAYWAYEDFTHTTLFTAGSLLYVLRQAGFFETRILDPDGLAGSRGLKRAARRVLLGLYRRNRAFWNKVTGSAYHAGSPQIFTYEIKAVTRAG